MTKQCVYNSAYYYVCWILLCESSSCMCYSLPDQIKEICRSRKNNKWIGIGDSFVYYMVKAACICCVGLGSCFELCTAVLHSLLIYPLSVNIWPREFCWAMALRMCLFVFTSGVPGTNCWGMKHIWFCDMTCCSYVCHTEETLLSILDLCTRVLDICEICMSLV